MTTSASLWQQGTLISGCTPLSSHQLHTLCQTICNHSGSHNHPLEPLHTYACQGTRPRTSIVGIVDVQAYFGRPTPIHLEFSVLPPWSSDCTDKLLRSCNFVMQHPAASHVLLATCGPWTNYMATLLPVDAWSTHMWSVGMDPPSQGFVVQCRQWCRDQTLCSSSLVFPESVHCHQIHSTLMHSASNACALPT